MFKSQVSCWSEGSAQVFVLRRGAARSNLANQRCHLTPIFDKIFRNTGDFSMGFAKFSPNSGFKKFSVEPLLSLNWSKLVKWTNQNHCDLAVPEDARVNPVIDGLHPEVCHVGGKDDLPLQNAL